MASGRLWPFNDRGGDLFRLVTSLGAKHEDYATHDRSSQYRSPLPLPQFASRYFIHFYQGCTYLHYAPLVFYLCGE